MNVNKDVTEMLIKLFSCHHGHGEMKKQNLGQSWLFVLLPFLFKRNDKYRPKNLGLSWLFLFLILFLRNDKYRPKDQWVQHTPTTYFREIFCSSYKLANYTEIAQSRTSGIFIRDTAYFTVIQWSIRSYFISSEWNILYTPYPVWKCLTHGTVQSL